MTIQNSTLRRWLPDRKNNWENYVEELILPVEGVDTAQSHTLEFRTWWVRKKFTPKDLDNPACTRALHLEVRAVAWDLAANNFRFKLSWRRRVHATLAKALEPNICLNGWCTSTSVASSTDLALAPEQPLPNWLLHYCLRADMYTQSSVRIHGKDLESDSLVHYSTRFRSLSVIRHLPLPTPIIIQQSNLCEESPHLTRWRKDSCHVVQGSPE